MAAGSEDRRTVSTMVWPPPLPGRVRWAWMLRLPWRRRRVRRILALLDGRVPEGSVLLDVGGGTGVGAEEAARRAPARTYRRRVVVDPQPPMLHRIPGKVRRRERFDLAVADAASLPFAESSADVVLSLGVLCCMTEEAIPRAVAEIRRVLRPGGWALVTVPRRRGDADVPTFEAHGFRREATLRPGWSLFQRPSASEGRGGPEPGGHGVGGSRRSCSSRSLVAPQDLREESSSETLPS